MYYYYNEHGVPEEIGTFPGSPFDLEEDSFAANYPGWSYTQWHGPYRKEFTKKMRDYQKRKMQYINARRRALLIRDHLTDMRLLSQNMKPRFFAFIDDVIWNEEDWDNPIVVIRFGKRNTYNYPPYDWEISPQDHLPRGMKLYRPNNELYKKVVDSINEMWITTNHEFVLLKELQKYYFQEFNRRDESIFGHNISIKNNIRERIVEIMSEME